MGRKIVVFIVSAILFEVFFILRRIRRDVIIQAHRSSCKVRVYLIRFNENLVFSTDSKPVKQNFKKILPVGAGFFHADGQTDVTKLIAAFRNFASALKTPPSDLKREFVS